MPDLPNELIANEIIIYLFMLIIIAFGYFFIRFAQRLERQFDKMIEAVQHQETLNAINEDEHEFFEEKLKAHGDVLNNHEKRITKIEIKGEK